LAKKMGCDIISPEPSLTVRVVGSGVLESRRLERAGMADSPNTFESGEHGLVRSRAAGFRELRTPAFSTSGKKGDRTAKVSVVRLGSTVSVRQARLQSFEDFGSQSRGATAPWAPPILASLVEAKKLRVKCGSGDTFATLRP